MIDRAKRRLRPLPPDDPESRLSRAARIRIEEAYGEAHAMVESAKDRFVQRREYMPEGAAQFEFEYSEARMEAAYIFLSVTAREFLAIGVTDSKLRPIMQYSLDATANSLGLSTTQKNALWARLYLVRPVKRPTLVDQPAGKKAKDRRRLSSGRGKKGRGKVPHNPGGRPAARLANGETIRNLRLKARLDQESLAESCGVSSRTIQRAEAGKVSAGCLARIATGLSKELNDLIRPEMLEK